MVKDLNTTVDRWQRKVAGAQQDYTDGVRNPGKDWQSSALNAEQSYVEGVQQSIQQRDWARGVSEVPTTEWQRKTLEKSARWGQGVSVAAPDYAQKMQVVLQNVEATVQDVDRSVGPRGPKGSEQNISRSAAFQRGMHNRTVQGRGGSAPAPSLTIPQPTDITQSAGQPFGAPPQPLPGTVVRPTRTLRSF